MATPTGYSKTYTNKLKWGGRKVGKGLMRKLGPGLITGASDDDPSGIATYSQVGAQFGYGMLWTMLFSYPLMAAVQQISARIGRVTGCGIAGNIARYYPPWLSYSVVMLLLVANVINLGADIGAMGAALQLIIGGPLPLYLVLFTFLSLLLQVFVSYRKYVNYLKWLTLTLFSYVATAFFVHIAWGRAIRATIGPSVSFTGEYFTALVAVLGTTISPYLFFWQASQEVQDVHVDPRAEPLKRAPRQAPAQLSRITVDTYIGMGFSNVIAFFIILATAATLHEHGETNIQTAAQAAKALEPLAGRFASALFAIGLIGTGLLAVPVLGGSAAYALGEALKWPIGLERKPSKARGFYGVLAAATLVGLLLNFLRVDLIKALFWSAVLNGMVAVPVLVIMMLMASNRKVMGNFTLPTPLRVLGWIATAVMFAAAVGLILSLRA